MSQQYTVSLPAKLDVVIPPGTLNQGTQISVSDIPDLKAHDFGGFVPMGLYDVSASHQGPFNGEISLEFTYDPALLDASMDEADQIAVAFWDEDYLAWKEIDFQLDAGSSKVTVKTNHLSLWSIFFKEDKYVTSTLPGFTIYFNKNASAPAIGAISSGDPIFEYASIVRTGLYDAAKAYSELGLKLPEHTRVYIDDWGAEKEAEWGWFSKNIEIPVTYIDEQELHMVAAHELFHAVQNQYINFASMSSNRWFMEATADYAAAHIATSYGFKEPLPYAYLKTSVGSSETFHMYQSAHFIKFLVDNGYNFKELFEGVINGSGGALASLNTYIATQGGSLSDIYKNFVYSVLFSNTVKTAPLEGNIYNSVADITLEFDLDTSKQASQMINVGSGYASKLMGVSIISGKDSPAAITIQAIEPTSGVQVEYILIDGQEKGPVSESGPLTHEPVEISVKQGQYLYFVVTNNASANGYVTIVIGKEIDGQLVYSNSRNAKIYNGYFVVDIDFVLTANQPFTITREAEIGDSLVLQIEFARSKNDVLMDVEANVSGLAFSDSAGWSDEFEPVFRQKYWSISGGDQQGSNATITIPQEGRSIAIFGYDVIIDIRNIKDNTYSWGGGASVIYVSASIVD
ncbi:MAG: hypothetical protein JW954_04865 [Dehalococcoidaceae bacterium]|nr:hypothetical protein [Dehalococcoidaceae bacterium]